MTRFKLLKCTFIRGTSFFSLVGCQVILPSASLFRLFLPICGACSSIAIGLPVLCSRQCQLMIYAGLKSAVQCLYFSLAILSTNIIIGLFPDGNHSLKFVNICFMYIRETQWALHSPTMLHVLTRIYPMTGFQSHRFCLCISGRKSVRQNRLLIYGSGPQTLCVTSFNWPIGQSR